LNKAIYQPAYQVEAMELDASKPEAVAKLYKQYPQGIGCFSWIVCLDFMGFPLRSD
jgi:hypothetical protein